MPDCLCGHCTYTKQKTSVYFNHCTCCRKPVGTFINNHYPHRKPYTHCLKDEITIGLGQGTGPVFHSGLVERAGGVTSWRNSQC